MHNFAIYNPVNLHFGKDCLQTLPKSLANYGKKVLLIYGKGAIKSNGLYQQITSLLADYELIEYSGIQPNPLVTDADAAALLAREHQVDIILAVGGGSVIDTAKMVSIGGKVSHSVWDFMLGKAQPTQAIPLIAVLTLAATGTEMNPFAVLQNPESMKKIGYGHQLIFPAESFLDPQFTYSVNAAYTAYGIVDLIAHSLEAYFGQGDSPLADRFVFSILEEAMEVGPALLKHLDNYELRARIMYAATMALNGTTAHGRKSGDWGVHAIGHELSLLFDMPHGASLSIAYPAWMKLMAESAENRLLELGSAVFGVDSVEETIAEFEAFFSLIGSPIRLSDFGIEESKAELIIQQFQNNRISGANFKINANDYDLLYQWMK
jgi:alcohol dehydrogenase YqhD (iron-dependent ADH family)